MAKAKIKRIRDNEAGTVSLDLLETGEALSLTFDSLSPEIQRNLGITGMVDAVTSAANKAKVSPFVAMSKKWENLVAGILSTRGEGVAKITDLVSALMEYSGQTQSEVEEKLDGMKAADETNGTKDVAKLKKHPDLQPILERMKTERQKEREKVAKAAKKENEAPLEF